MKRKKLAVAVAGVAAAIATLAPTASHAAAPTCVIINGPHGFHLQIGYAPNGPASCKVING